MAIVFPVLAGPETIKPRRALIACRFSKISRRPQATVCRTVEVATTSRRAWWSRRASS
jgi:hypothetical protein